MWSSLSNSLVEYNYALMQTSNSNFYLTIKALINPTTFMMSYLISKNVLNHHTIIKPAACHAVDHRYHSEICELTIVMHATILNSRPLHITSRHQPCSQAIHSHLQSLNACNITMEGEGLGNLVMWCGQVHRRYTHRGVVPIEVS